MNKLNLLIATSAVALLSAAPASAAGFKIVEKGGRAQAMANAGMGATTVSKDAAALGFNVASSAFAAAGSFNGATSLQYIMPKADFTADATNTLGDTNPASSKENAFVPALYLAWKANDHVGFGLSITAPFGLATEYAANSNVRYSAVRSALKTLNINPSISVKLRDNVAVGLGVFAQRAFDVELTKVTNTGFGEFTTKAVGADWAYGWNAGLLFMPWENGRFGVAYQSHVHHKLTGSVNHDGLAAVNTAAAAGGAPGATVAGGLLRSNIIEGAKAIRAPLTTPEHVNLSYAHDVNDQLTLNASAEWTRWTRYKDQKIFFSNANDKQPTASSTEVGSGEAQNWANAWMFMFGADYKINEAWTVMLGTAYDQTPTNDTDRSARLPDQDRIWLSGGVEWNCAEWAKVSLSYTHIFVKDATVNKTNAFSNTTEGTFSSSVDIIGVQANFKF